jgi:DNA-binding response OmpR family regulator
MIDRTRVLVVDDEQVVCESCRRALLEEGYEVSTATDPRQGLERARNENFELVILDLKMPGISGLQVLQGIK